MMTNRWRPLRAADLSDVAQIAAAAFPDHYEEPACFAERLALSPSWCFGLEDAAGALHGYLIAYPWPLGFIPPLNALLGSLPVQSDALFLHDLALYPDAAGTGQASSGVELLAHQAERAGFADIALVAVNDTAGFWLSRGFADEDVSPLLRTKLADYGEDARYMRRRVASD